MLHWTSKSLAPSTCPFTPTSCDGSAFYPVMAEISSNGYVISADSRAISEETFYCRYHKQIIPCRGSLRSREDVQRKDQCLHSVNGRKVIDLPGLVLIYIIQSVYVKKLCTSSLRLVKVKFSRYWQCTIGICPIIVPKNVYRPSCAIHTAMSFVSLFRSVVNLFASCAASVLFFSIVSASVRPGMVVAPYLRAQ